MSSGILPVGVMQEGTTPPFSSQAIRGINVFVDCNLKTLSNRAYVQ